MKTTAPKKGRGRPRNPALDALQAELAVSRRRASSVLKEVKTSKATTSENSMPALSPLAAARLEKLQREIQFLETRIRSAELEERALSRELLYSSEAVELFNAALQPIVNTLHTWPKALAPRLHGQPMGAIEKTLLDAANNLLANARTNLATMKSKIGKDL
jgi:hypothetical protein